MATAQVVRLKTEGGNNYISQDRNGFVPVQSIIEFSREIL